jgi:hypothetical protein
MEVREAVGTAGLDKHPDHDPEKRRDLRHRLLRYDHITLRIVSGAHEIGKRRGANRAGYNLLNEPRLVAAMGIVWVEEERWVG